MPHFARGAFPVCPEEQTASEMFRARAGSSVRKLRHCARSGIAQTRWNFASMRLSGLPSILWKGFPPPLVRPRGLKLKTKIEKREAVLAEPGQKPGIFGARALVLRGLENGRQILREHRARHHFQAT